MFFDMSGLTDYLIAQKGQSKPNYPEKPQGVNFEDFLNSLVQKSDVQKQSYNNLDLENAFLGLPVTQPDGMSTNDSAVMGTNKPAAEIPIETTESVLMAAAGLKEIAKSQAIPVAIDLQQTKIVPDSKIDLMALTGNEYIENPDISGLGDNSAYQAEIAGGNLPEELPSFARLEFTTDQLFTENQQNALVKVTSSGEAPIEMKISIDELRQAVENYPEKITIQTKPNIDMQSETSANPRLTVISADRSNEAGASEKRVLFDLRSIISADDLEQINIIQKTVSTINRTGQNSRLNAPEIDLLNGLQYDRNRLIKVRDNSITTKSSTTTGEKSNQQEMDVRNMVSEIKMTSRSNQLTEGDRTVEADKYQSESKDQPAAKQSAGSASQVVNPTGNAKSMPSLDAAKGSSQPVDEVNSLQQMNLKSSDAQVEFKTTEMAASKGAGMDNMETAEKIIGQIKSKLAVTPEHTRMTIDLKPKSLGQIRIDFKYEREDLKALIQVENSKVKSLLEAELPRLKDELKIDSFKVEVNSNNFHQGTNSRNHHNLFSQYEDNQMPRYRDSKESGNAVETKSVEKTGSGYAGGNNNGMINLLV